jgi:hypothetical protein
MDGGGETQHGDFDSASKRKETVPVAEGSPRGQGTQEGSKINSGRGHSSNQRSSVKVIINKNNSQTAQQRKASNAKANGQRLDIGDLLVNMGMETGTSAGQFDFAGGLLSEGGFSPVGLSHAPQKKAVRLKGSMGKGHSQISGEGETNAHGFFRYARMPDGNEEQSTLNASLQRALHISPQGASLDASHIRSHRDGFMTLAAESPPAFLQNSLSHHLGSLQKKQSRITAAQLNGQGKSMHTSHSINQSFKTKTGKRGSAFERVDSRQNANGGESDALQSRKLAAGAGTRQASGAGSINGLSSPTNGLMQAASGLENKNMLYSVKNHQLYHSQRMQNR